MAKKKYIYFNQKTGDIAHMSRAGGKKLPEDWRELEFGENEKGEKGMRFRFNGATIFVTETGQQEVSPDAEGGLVIKDEIPEGEIVSDVDTNAK